ncbi:MAG: cysteine peptidase family C39 domain-containing protein [Candidatus Uhrbacteria bacterium]
MPKHLPVQPFRQTPGFCGPACLKMVFQYHDVLVSEAAVAKAAHAKRATGTELEGMKDAAAHFGFSLRFQDNASFADVQALLKKGIPPIVDWFSTDDGHYSVVVGLDAKSIYLQDPELGAINKIDRKTFFRCWFDFPGEYIQRAYDVIVRRLMVVEPK